MNPRVLNPAFTALVLGALYYPFGPYPVRPAEPPLPRLAAAADDVQDFVYFGETRPVLVRVHVWIDGKPLTAAWDDFLQALFKDLDRDGDGVLSKEEAERVPPPALFFGGGLYGGASPPTLATLDADGDGRVTLPELKAYYRKNGGGPFHLQTGPATDNGPVVRLGGRGPAQSNRAEALNRALFDLLDTNHDGKLSQEELRQAPARLLKLDANDDEMVTANEVLGQVDAMEGGVFVFSASEGAGLAADGPFLLVDPGRPTARMVRELQTRYGPRGRRRDIKLRRQDLGLDAAAFDQLDTNRDGVLDAGELARFARRTPDLEIAVRVGKTAAGEVPVEVVTRDGKPAPLASAVHKARGGGLALQVGNARLTLNAPPARDSGMVVKGLLRQVYEQQFKAADKDNNGYLDADEARQSPFFAGTFKLMDRDGDGKLYEKEMFAYLDRMEGLQKRAMASCVSLNVAGEGNGLFDLLDLDHDGRLSVREMRQAVRLVERLDQDGDGQVSRAEIPRRYQLGFRQGASGSNPAGPKVFVVQGMVGTAPQQSERRAGPLWFRKMDRNRDGDVSRREFLGTAEQFDRIDADHDGLISVAEAERYDAEVRNARRGGR